MKKIFEFFSEEGILSANRLMLIVCGFTIIGTWAFLSIKNDKILMEPAVPWIFASLLTAKVAQKIVENNSPPS